MAKIIVNGKLVEAPDNTTILKACEQIDIEIPVFCYHKRLSLAGNCRMCLVEVEGSAKPVASCFTPIRDGMSIQTNSEKVIKARSGVLEFLLINHPLDCPICDQGGECDLQDITINYGRGESRFHLNKRAVVDKNMGPLIKTIMNRCIHCTRCIRFSTEIAGVDEIATTGRGEETEIVTYLNQSITSELSGNLIDVCPVGAITNKPYAFVGRSWELEKTDSIDVLDAVGSNIRIDSRDSKIMRIMPRLNEEINEEWISDRTRFAYDGLKYQRLTSPYIRIDGQLVKGSWTQAFETIALKMNGIPSESIAAIAGDLIDCEAMFCLKELMDKLGCKNYDCRQDGNSVPIKYRGDYLFNTTISGIEKADALLLIATNPRHEASMLNARIRKRFNQGNFPIALIGPKVSLNYDFQYLGNEARILRNLLDLSYPFVKILYKAKNPMMVLGGSALNRNDSQCLFYLAQMIAKKFNMVRDDWNGFNVLQTVASRVGGLDLDFLPGAKGLSTNKILKNLQNIKILYLLGADEIKINKSEQTFIIYQGHHGDKGAQIADVILPGLTYSEKVATFVNLEGRVQSTQAAVPPPGEAKEDWKIIRALSEFLSCTLPYNTLSEVRQAMAKANPIFTKYDQITTTEWNFSHHPISETISQLPFELPIKNYYQNDPISRHSKIMATCSKDLAKI